MIKGADVLSFLRPEGGWVIRGDEFEGIEFIECEPLTKKEFEDGFIAFEKWQKEQELSKAAEKEALLNRLGLTADEAKLLLS